MGKTTLLALPHLDTSCVAVGTKRSDAVGFTKKTLQLIALFHMRNQKGVNKDPDGAERGRRGGCKSGGADESTAGPFGGGGVGCYFLF